MFLFDYVSLSMIKKIYYPQRIDLYGIVSAILVAMTNNSRKLFEMRVI